MQLNPEGPPERVNAHDVQRPAVGADGHHTLIERLEPMVGGDTPRRLVVTVGAVGVIDAEATDRREHRCLLFNGASRAHARRRGRYGDAGSRGKNWRDFTDSASRIKAKVGTKTM
jgi:hypothetical protein